MKMTEQQVAAFCLSLPGAREDYKWGGVRVFSIAGNKMFALQNLRGESLGLKLLTEVVHLAHERGHSHLFLYTKPENVEFFRSCGFYLLAEVPGYVALMENTPIGIRTYCDRLTRQRRDGKVIHYSIRDPKAAAITALVYDLFCGPGSTRP